MAAGDNPPDLPRATRPSSAGHGAHGAGPAEGGRPPPRVRRRRRQQRDARWPACWKTSSTCRCGSTATRSMPSGSVPRFIAGYRTPAGASGFTWSRTGSSSPFAASTWRPCCATTASPSCTGGPSCAASTRPAQRAPDHRHPARLPHPPRTAIRHRTRCARPRGEAASTLGQSGIQEAIEDYAHACPQAGVLLANHGPCGKTLMAHVAPEASPAVRSRAAMSIPGTWTTSSSSATTSRAWSTARSPARWPGRSSSHARSALTWGALPADLDLHVYPQAGGHLFYHQPRGEGAELGPDVTSGYGPERATVHAANGVYAIAVHQFSESGDLSASGAVVEIAIGPHFDRSHHRFEVPREKAVGGMSPASTCAHPRSPQPRSATTFCRDRTDPHRPRRHAISALNSSSHTLIDFAPVVGEGGLARLDQPENRRAVPTLAEQRDRRRPPASGARRAPSAASSAGRTCPRRSTARPSVIRRYWPCSLVTR